MGAVFLDAEFFFGEFLFVGNGENAAEREEFGGLEVRTFGGGVLAGIFWTKCWPISVYGTA